MNSKEKRADLEDLINNIKEHSDRLKKMPHMPVLEVSAILSKINRMHETAVVLKYLIAEEQDHEEEEFSPDLPNLDQVADVEEDENSNSAESQEQEQDHIDSYDDDPEQEDDLDIDERKIDLKPEFQSVEDSANIKSEIKKMEDKAGMSAQVDLNDQFADEQEDRSLSEQLKKQPIADLLTAIGLNERYLYANDLFGGDIEEFKKAIRILNELESEQEASRYFNEELRKAYGWEKDNELAEALLLLVKRRFQ